MRAIAMRPGRRAVTLAMLGAAGVTLAACSSGPPPVTYVLGTPASDSSATVPLAGRPVVEVKPVLVPDYLDTSDIQLRRDGNVVAPSTTGRWAERLSAGVTRAMAAELTRRLPGLVVATTVPAERPARQVLAEIQSFEPRSNGVVVLVGRWRVLDGAARDTLAGESVSLTAPLAGQGDAEVVAAMTRLIEDLAGRIADGVRRTTPGSASRRG
ncbi:PqiC family protein [Plastoroseomonas hellenica]|nr:PqiC family protein [Plastoroseomonas hellenica]